MRLGRWIIGLVLALVCAAPAHAQLGMPEGFYTTTTAGFTMPTAFAAAPDGRVFVAEKRGVVKVFNPSAPLPPALLLDISTHVNNAGDRGLLGIAVDHAFASNGYLYLYYVYEHTKGKANGKKVARLTRVTVNPDNTLGNPVVPETTLLGSYTPGPLADASCPAMDDHLDCIPAETLSHNGGALRTDSDGTVWLAIGDANLGFAEPNRYRPYDERSFAGKIVHVDRNGHGLPDHPFCPGDLDLTKVCSKLWAKGFRNPFRMGLRPGKGPVVGDVGQNRWEEMDLATAGGNYGWPCYEGSGRFSTLASTGRCISEYAKEGTSAASLPPAWQYEHTPGVGAAIVQGPRYSGTRFPGRYRGDLFVGDYVKGTIERVIVDEQDRFVRVEPFAREWRGVDLQEMPDGRLGYILLAGTFGTIDYSIANAPPTAAAAASTDHGSLPLSVSFDATASTDADGDVLAYDWNFGDGSPPGSGQTVSHTFKRAGRFTVTVTVSDGRGGSDTDSVTVWAGDSAPEPVILAPADEALYRNGVAVALRGSATDPEDGALPAGALQWSITLHHGIHAHPFSTQTGPDASFTPLEDHDADSYYEVTLKATDSQGLSASRTINLRPQTVRLTLASNPPGAVLSYSGDDRVAPFTVDTAIGFRGSLSAPTTLVAGDRRYVFDRWSDGGAQAHTITVPDRDIALTAIYREDSDPPETTITERPLQNTPYKSNTFAFVSDEPNSRFECRNSYGPWFACTSPYKTPPMAKGWHGFLVRAIDVAGNVDPSPAFWEYQIYAQL